MRRALVPAGNAGALTFTPPNTSGVLVDTIAPTVTINQAGIQADPTNASPINFTVVFSESVADFVTGDVTIGGTAPGTKTGAVTGSGTTYNVAVSGMTGSGTVTVCIAAGVALFFSLDIGLYAIGGAILTLIVLAVTPSVSEGPGGEGGARNGHLAHAPPSSLAPLGMTSLFVIGAVVGAAPFVIYLAMRGALGAFLTTSFVVVPRVIDAVASGRWRFDSRPRAVPDSAAYALMHWDERKLTEEIEHAFDL